MSSSNRRASAELGGQVVGQVAEVVAFAGPVAQRGSQGPGPVEQVGAWSAVGSGG